MVKSLDSFKSNLSDCFIVSFGEIFNSVTQSYEMDIIIRYWDAQTQNVRVRYWGSKFLGHTTNNDLLDKSKDGTSMLNMKNLKQILMDCPNVNWKFFECFINQRESEE